MERPKVYLDSNVFIYAQVSNEKIGDFARQVLRHLDKFEGVISSLAIDEIVWVIRKELDLRTAIEVGEKIFELPLKILPINPETVFGAFKFMKKYGINPRDCIHISCMLENNVRIVVTEDSDFMRVKEIEALTIPQFLKKF